VGPHTVFGLSLEERVAVQSDRGSGPSAGQASAVTGHTILCKGASRWVARSVGYPARLPRGNAGVQMAAARARSGGRTKRKHSAGAEALQLDREAVRHWRLQRGWTQEALAGQRALLDGQAQSISYAQIRRIERDGRCGPASA